jgi:CxxC-x17-CxxC domain-containing protein
MREQSMEYNRNNKFSERRDGGGRKDFGERGFGNRGSAKPILHKTKCDECGRACEVPFRPTGKKPVLCNHCFKGQGNNAPFKRFDGDRDSRRPRFENKQAPTPVSNNDIYKEQFGKINKKLNIILEALVSISAKIAIPEEAEITEPEVKETPLKKSKKVTEPKAKKVAAPKKAKKAAVKKAVVKKVASKKAAVKKKK